MNDEFKIDYTAEPRKVFVNFLIWNIKQIETDVFQNRNRTPSVLSPLIGLISSLDEKSKKTLDPQNKRLLAMRRDTYEFSLAETEKIYGEILAYLHSTYLSEVSRVRPWNPQPEHIGEKRDG